MVKTESWQGRAVLMVAHCAGMVDLVALPVWVGTLVSAYGLDPQQAGGLATLFLLGAVASSTFFAPRFNRIGGRVAAALGFGMAALAFFALSFVAQTTRDVTTMAALHAAAGAAAGCGLSFTHGTIGRSRNPHRMFALVGVALGVFAVGFFVAVPQLVAAFGGAALFRVFAGVMAVAALLSALAFPVPHAQPAAGAAAAWRAMPRMPRAVWFVVFGIACLGLVQAMIFSFIERIGSDRGFGFAAVSGVLIALGLVNLLPSPLAALLQRRWPAHRVVLLGPLAQAAVALTITQSSSFVPYAVATCLFAGVMIFTHNFAFGLLAALDPSGRAVAATPAMLMMGAAIGPVLGGTLVKASGYGSLGVVAAVMAALAMASFWRVRPRARRQSDWRRRSRLPAHRATTSGAALMLPAIHRVVTGHDAGGKAVVTSDGALPTVVELTAIPDTVFHEVWSTAATPAPVDNGADPTNLAIGPLTLPPPRGGTRIRFVDIPPDSAEFLAHGAARMQAAFGEIGDAAASTVQAHSPHPLMHRTESVDYGVVIDGELTLVLDDSEVQLQAGSVVVQRGTNHAWANRSGKPCRMLFVLVDGHYDPAIAAALAER